MRFACTRAGDVWVQADLPACAVEPEQHDRVLGLVVEGALAARGYAAALDSPHAAGGGWLSPDD